MKISTRLVAGLAVCLALGTAPRPSLAHPGGTDANGCHTNRKTGDRHCHGQKAGGVSRRSPPRPQAEPQRLTGDGSLYYPNCKAARAAGAAPIRRGEPGYGSHLDRDDDGVACE